MKIFCLLYLPQFRFADGSRSVDLVCEDEDGAVPEVLVAQEAVQLGPGLWEPGLVPGVHQEHDGVHRWEVIPPNPPGLEVASEIKSGEPDKKGWIGGFGVYSILHPFKKLRQSLYISPDVAELDLLRGGVQGRHVLLHVARHESPQQSGLTRVVQAQEQQLA